MTDDTTVTAPEPAALDTTDDTAALAAFLAQRDITCPNCHYNLRGLQSDQCPECGLGLALQVDLVEPKMAGFIVGLIGLTALVFLAFSIEFLLLLEDGLDGIMFDLNPWHIARDQERAAFLSALSLLIGVPALGVWLGTRRRQRQLGAVARRSWVGACLALPVVYLVIFALWVF